MMYDALDVSELLLELLHFPFRRMLTYQLAVSSFSHASEASVHGAGAVYSLARPSCPFVCLIHSFVRLMHAFVRLSRYVLSPDAQTQRQP